jgi:hypothetical protein
MKHELRRSRKHLLDWLGCEDFRDALNGLLGSSGVSVSRRDIHRPVGHGDGVEFELPDFCWCFRPRWKVHESLRSWWLPPTALRKDARTPVWDLISTCSVLGRQGLLLVEAKTQEDEFDWKGKPLEAKGSEQTKATHERVKAAVRDISHRLAGISRAKAILEVERHYQLTHRVAWAAFLASLGIPVALLYLGFTGDSTMPGFLKDDAHWQRAMGAYLLGKLSLGLPEKVVRFPGGGMFAFLIRSRPVLGITRTGHDRRAGSRLSAGKPRRWLTGLL